MMSQNNTTLVPGVDSLPPSVIYGLTNNHIIQLSNESSNPNAIQNQLALQHLLEIGAKECHVDKIISSTTQANDNTNAKGNTPTIVFIPYEFYMDGKQYEENYRRGFHNEKAKKIGLLFGESFLIAHKQCHEVQTSNDNYVRVYNDELLDGSHTQSFKEFVCDFLKVSRDTIINIF